MADNILISVTRHQVQSVPSQATGAIRPSEAREKTCMHRRSCRTWRREKIYTANHVHRALRKNWVFIMAMNTQQQWTCQQNSQPVNMDNKHNHTFLVCRKLACHFLMNHVIFELCVNVLACWISAGSELQMTGIQSDWSLSRPNQIPSLTVMSTSNYQQAI